MSRPTAVLFCPGRGAYGREELGFLRRHLRAGPAADALAAADAARDPGETITEIDGAERFRPGLHLKGVNAAELIYLGTMLHTEHLRERYDIVAVAGLGGRFGNNVLANQMFNESFQIGDTGLGAAIAIVMFVIVLPVMIYNIYNMQKEAI